MNGKGSSEQLQEKLETAVAKAGLVLVEAKFLQKKNSTRVYLVVYSSAGTGTEDCSKVYWETQPLLLSELGCDEDHLFIEVSSPGLDRVFKSRKEYDIFLGKQIRIVKKDGTALTGLLQSTDQAAVAMETGTGNAVVPFEEIAKACLFSEIQKK